MKTKTETKIVITLEMSEDEAQWLHGVTQNPLHGDDILSESLEDHRIRNAFFDATRPGN